MSAERLANLKARTIGDLVAEVSSHPEIMSMKRLKGEGVFEGVDEPVMVIVGVGQAAHELLSMFMAYVDYLQARHPDAILVDKGAIPYQDLRGDGADPPSRG